MNKLLSVSNLIILVILIIVGFLGYKFYKSRVLPSYNLSYFIKEQKSNKFERISSDYISNPLDGFNYTMSFWLYLDDYVYNFDYWRHVLHIGEDVRKSDLGYKTWDSLSEDIPNQNPGIWMHPKTNKLRLAFTTHLIKQFCSTIETQNLCDLDYCLWENNKCVDNDPNATNLMGDKINPNQTSKYILEYVDIDIPLKKLINISFKIDGGVLFIRINGKLSKIYKFMGHNEFKNDGLFFFKPKSIRGSLMNFYYIPTIEKLSNFANFVPKINM